jgi:hypothetical protein
MTPCNLGDKHQAFFKKKHVACIVGVEEFPTARKDSVDGITSGYFLGSSGFEPQRRQNYFPSQHPSIPILEHTQPPVKEILGSFPVVKRPRHRVENPHLSSAEVKNG